MSALMAALARWPKGRPALVDDHGPLTAAELLRAVQAETRWLSAAGPRHIGLLADNGRGWVVTDLAMLNGGLVNIPLPQHFGAGQLIHTLNSAGVTAVATDSPRRILDLQLGFRQGGQSTRTGLVLLVRGQAGPVQALPAGTRKITFTSGSTANPKGVCLRPDTMEAVAASIAKVAARQQIRRHLALLPLATLLENVAGVYAAWQAGATCHLPSASAGAIARGTLRPGLLLQEISRQQPESLILVPELLRILVTGAESGWRPPAQARFFAVGGARVSPQLLERAAALGIPAFEGYGLSECGSVVCLNTPDAAKPGSAGRPLPHAEVSVDRSGEIHVAGTRMAAYLGDTADRQEAPVATGDLGEIDDEGFVHVRGRTRNIIINSLGRNLSPEWIESELAQEGAIAQSVVFGEARPSLVALITPVAPDIPAEAIAAGVARVNSRLPAYARIARYRVIPERFSLANDLLTGNGRPKREHILRRYAHHIDQLYEESDLVIS